MFGYSLDVVAGRQDLFTISDRNVPNEPFDHGPFPDLLFGQISLPKLVLLRNRAYMGIS